MAKFTRSIGTGFFLATFILSVSFLLTLPANGQDRVLADETGRKIKVPPSPGRIVSLVPNVTEILFSLGLDAEIAGVTDFCDYPEAALRKPRVGGYINPSLEKIVSLKPDLIIGAREGIRMEALQALVDLGFPVYLIDPWGFDGTTKTISDIGELVKRRNESAKIVNRMTAARNRVVSLTRSLPKPKIYFQLGAGSMVTVGRGTLADDLIRFAGGASISGTELAGYPLYSIETILSKAPEIIIVSSMEGKKDYSNVMARWRQFKSIPAVKKGAIHIVDSNLVDRPTPRIVEGLEILVRIIHPEIVEKKR